jgi:hypothetical protein
MTFFTGCFLGPIFNHGLVDGRQACGTMGGLASTEVCGDCLRGVQTHHVSGNR